jgi:RNA polymerase sigma-70 factor, ECF subfamily
MILARQSTDERRERFEQAALPLLDDVYRAALAMARSPAGARQLVQETYARAYAAYELLGRDAEPRTWLFRVLTDTFVYSYRRQPDSAVARALDALPDELRIAVYLADVERFSYAQIADIMTTSTDIVLDRLRRGRRQLRAHLPAPTVSA